MITFFIVDWNKWCHFTLGTARAVLVVALVYSFLEVFNVIMAALQGNFGTVTDVQLKLRKHPNAYIAIKWNLNLLVLTFLTTLTPLAKVVFIMPFGLVTLIFYWPKKCFRVGQRQALISSTAQVNRSINLDSWKLPVREEQSYLPLCFGFSSSPNKKD
jgi:hypothetical protein